MCYVERVPPNLLYLTHRVPYPPDRGDRIRNWHVLKFLSQRASVWLGCLADEPPSEETSRILREICAHVAIEPLDRSRWLRAAGGVLLGRTVSEGAFASPKLRRIIAEWAKQANFTAAIASASSLVPYLRTRELRGVPAVVDVVDVDSQKFFDYAAAAAPPRSWLYRLEGWRLRRVEAALPAWAKAVLLVSPAEAGLFNKFAKPGPVYAITCGVDLDYFCPRPMIEEPACVFVGVLDYRPNVDAACWFVKAVWPELHRRRPELRFRLVGRQPTPAVRELAKTAGVTVIGEVPDVRPALAAASVAVMPLRIARGVQNKVLEALAMGKACVASPAALAGVPAVPGEHLLSATTPPEWVLAVERLLDDADLRSRLGATGRAYVEMNHTWERCLEPLACILDL
ncbi:MAG: TIGR03087 family PEP-CTERM/XrtA system glycosyltransferase [Gemmataceae bacterium]